MPVERTGHDGERMGSPLPSDWEDKLGRSPMRAGFVAALSAAFVAFAPVQATAGTAPKQVTVKGEIVDTWCYVTEIMWALGTAHHQCALWCAVGGIPVSIRDADDNVYVVLKIEGDDTNVANPRILRMQTHEVTVNGDLYERDGVKYLLVTQVADEHGIVNLTHDDYGIVPFGE